MSTYHYKFERVTIRGVRSGTCPVCGKRGTTLEMGRLVRGAA